MQSSPPPQPDVTAAFTIAGLLGALGVALGAFGAHALKGAMATAVDGAQRLVWWDTATKYHLWHALLAAVCASLIQRYPRVRISLMLCIVGTMLFSGSLYVMTLTNFRILGAITPLGGVAFIAAWLALVFAVRRPAA